MNILGISAYYHDSAAVLMRDGVIVAAAQEERFSRKKHDPAFPNCAIAYCLEEGGITLDAVDFISFYDKPLLKFERLLETYLAYAPRGFRSFVTSMPVWLKEKLFLKDLLRREVADMMGTDKSGVPPLLFGEHHESHAASAFYPSPFEEAAVLCMDGVGEWATTSVWIGQGSALTPVWQIDFPHSLGLLYSAFTYYAGFKVNSGEYKLMGLAPYGEPKYVDLILEHLLYLKGDGTFRLDMRYFNYADGLTMTNRRFDNLFGAPPRQPESPITQREMDIAASIQVVTEEVVLRLAKTVHRELKVDNLCLAGGVALNCVANGHILREAPVDDIFVQPAAGDAGGAMGAALWAWHDLLDKPRAWKLESAYLGPGYTDDEIQADLDSYGAVYRRLDRQPLLDETAALIDQSMVVGWYQGRREWGPRALGHRSILGDARNLEMREIINAKIKMREGFRPFAPSCLEEDASDYFELDRPSPYMLLVAQVRDDIREGPQPLPSITHVDGSARIQTINRQQDALYYDLISAFKQLTGCSVVINTSMNVRGEPVVNTAEDAYRCFMRTHMDALVCGPFLMLKDDQPDLELKTAKEEFGLD